MNGIRQVMGMAVIIARTGMKMGVPVEVMMATGKQIMRMAMVVIMAGSAVRAAGFVRQVMRITVTKGTICLTKLIFRIG
jgi:hypothetical protein